MSRKRWIYDGAGNAVELTGDGYARTHFIRDEIAPVRSMLDGRTYDSRAKYEEHLRRNGMRVVDPSEVSPEKIMQHKPDYNASPDKRRELIRAQVDAMPHEQFRAAIKRDIDRVKWNSNH